MGLSKTNIGTTPDGKPLSHVSGEHVITWNDTSTETSITGFGVEVLPAA